MLCYSIEVVPCRYRNFVYRDVQLWHSNPKSTTVISGARVAILQPWRASTGSTVWMRVSGVSSG